MRMFRRASLLTVAVCSAAIAADDTCTTDGGTAECTGPEVGPYTYHVQGGSGSVSGAGNGPSQASATAAYEADYRRRRGPGICTVNVVDNTPPWQPDKIGSGSAQQGTYPNTFWDQDWKLSREFQSKKTQLRRMTATWTRHNDPEPCQGLSEGWGSVSRSRTVACPVDYLANTSGVSNSYCYRRPTARDSSKVLGNHCPKIGNPAHPSTGNKFQAEVDYVGTGPMPLRFTRSYNSRMLSGVAYKSALGLNWRSTYDRIIGFSDSTFMPTAYVYRADGQTLRFKLVSGVFQPDADIADQFVRLTDGAGNPTGWKYTVAGSDDVETYDNDGKLIQIKNRAGLTHSLSYDGDGRLSVVADDFGKTLTLAYDASGRLASLTDPDGQVYVYGYSVVNNVNAVSYPGGTTRTYHYNEPAHTSNRPNALTGITDESATRFSTYKYDQYNRVASTEHAGGVEKYSLTYNGTGSWNTATTVTDPLLQQRVYTFSTTLGVDRNTSISQPSSGGCGGSAAAAQTYDANGNVSNRTDFNGRVTNFTYDLARNLETSRTEASAHLSPARSRRSGI